VKTDSSYPPDGVDLLPVVKGQAPEFPRAVYWRTQDMGVARDGDWKYVRWDNYEDLHNLSEDETENANFKLKNAAEFERLRRAYDEWDKQMLPVPPEARRGPYGSTVQRAQSLEILTKKK